MAPTGHWGLGVLADAPQPSTRPGSTARNAASWPPRRPRARRRHPKAMSPATWPGSGPLAPAAETDTRAAVPRARTSASVYSCGRKGRAALSREPRDVMRV